MLHHANGIELESYIRLLHGICDFHREMELARRAKTSTRGNTTDDDILVNVGSSGSYSSYHTREH